MFDDRAAEFAAAHAYQCCQDHGRGNPRPEAPRRHSGPGGRGRLWRPVGGLPFRQLPHHREAGKEALGQSRQSRDRSIKAAPRPSSRSRALADAIILARDLVSEPANILYPEEFARRVKKLTEPRPRGGDSRRKGDEEARHGRAPRASARAARAKASSPSFNGRAPRTRRPRRSPLSARAFASTPGGSASSRPKAWRR